jgi:hypothetical protein
VLLPGITLLWCSTTMETTTSSCELIDVADAQNLSNQPRLITNSFSIVRVGATLCP